MSVREKIRGQGLVEYALIMILVVLVVILALSIFGGKVSDLFSNVVANI